MTWSSARRARTWKTSSPNISNVGYPSLVNQSYDLTNLYTDEADEPDEKYEEEYVEQDHEEEKL